ncbi:hypothetical protein QEN19_004156 [Hanseniaspora menglaensis]
MDNEFVGKRVNICTTSGARFKGVLEKIDVDNGTITINNLQNTTPPYQVYHPTQVQSFSGNDLTELNIEDEENEVVEENIDEQVDALTTYGGAYSPENDVSSMISKPKETESTDSKVLSKQELFERELEAMRAERSKQGPKPAGASSFFDSFDDYEEGKSENTKYSKQSNFDTFGESGYKSGNSAGRGRGGYRGRGSSNNRGRGDQRGRGGHGNKGRGGYNNNSGNKGGEYYQRPSESGSKFDPSQQLF